MKLGEVDGESEKEKENKVGLPGPVRDDVT